jgi:hypothetical protein
MGEMAQEKAASAPAQSEEDGADELES